MFFLLRMAFWLGLVLVLLPTDKSSDADKGQQIGASEAISAATAAVSDMSQFCNRQPAACTVGGQAATVIGERAQSGAKKVYQFITDKAEKNEKNEKKAPEPTDKANKKAPDHTGSIGAPDDRDPDESQTVAVVHQTLTQDDLAIDWLPPAAGTAAGQ
ncbi:MAG: DUF5330 domain-containing protein [Pseudomonadota bacterium]